MKEKNTLNHEENHQLNPNVEYQMQKKLTKKIMRKIMTEILIVFMIVGGSHFMLDAYHYDPTKEDVPFEFILDAYVWTFYPGKMVSTWTIDKKGFGNYDLQLEVEDSYGSRIIGNEPDTLEIRRSRMNGGLSSIGLFLQSKFDRDYLNEYSYEIYPDEKEKLIQHLEQLPDSAYIDASLVLKNSTSLEEMVKMMNQYSNTQFVWLAMEQYETLQRFVTGMNLNQFMYGEAPQQYPHFFDMAQYENEEKTVDMLMTYYLEVLQVLVDHPQAYEVLNHRNFNSQYDNLLKQVEYSKENQNCIGFTIHTNKTDLIEMLESEMILYTWMDDVKVSVYSKISSQQDKKHQKNFR